MLEFNQMLDAGVHFGHLKRKWNPKMAPYIFMEKNGIHIIDLHKTAAKVEEASAALKQIAKSGKKVLFVATKKQAKDIVAERVKRTNMPFVTERWPGGMLTNFVTIRKAVKKMNSLEKLLNDKDTTTISKRERLQITREKAKLEKNLGSIADLTRLPSALFIVDINKEHIAVAEARRLNIPTFAMVDTNCDPEAVNFAIPANDDASKSIALIIDYVCQAIEEGMQERKLDKDSRMAEQAEEENDRLATELLDDEVSDEKEDNKIRKVKSVAEDTMEKRPRKQISKKGTARK
ncbi:MAG: 30S ribosomal protein S2 [Candidatus Onthomorpha sp.]|nr:30S ribosomal protein S2 [Bacteroidales bacterium]MDD7590346.1 30S ribosomal protein S2 [Bacteroidales bacterium]MDY5825752.1 30S ribosomal protein S2 [Candidatus Onthomorpha sp.]